MQSWKEELGIDDDDLDDGFSDDDAPVSFADVKAPSKGNTGLTAKSGPASAPSSKLPALEQLFGSAKNAKPASAARDDDEDDDDFGLDDDLDMGPDLPDDDDDEFGVGGAQSASGARRQEWLTDDSMSLSPSSAPTTPQFGSKDVPKSPFASAEAKRQQAEDQKRKDQNAALRKLAEADDNYDDDFEVDELVVDEEIDEEQDEDEDADNKLSVDLPRQGPAQATTPRKSPRATLPAPAPAAAASAARPPPPPPPAAAAPKPPPPQMAPDRDEEEEEDELGEEIVEGDDEDVMYVDEDGNPLTAEEVRALREGSGAGVEERVVYVDEDGNEVIPQEGEVLVDQDGKEIVPNPAAPATPAAAPPPVVPRLALGSLVPPPPPAARPPADQQYDDEFDDETTEEGGTSEAVSDAASEASETVAYVDEDGNPVDPSQLAADEFEYVDQDGNPVSRQEVEELEAQERERVAKAREQHGRAAREKAAREDEQRLQQERQRQDAEERARREAEERASREADEKARRAADEKARLDEERARKEADERVRKEAEEKARKEAEERSRKEAEERVKREAEERTRREEEAKKRAEEQAQKEAQEAARAREAQERIRKEAEERARKEAEDRARRDAEAERSRKEAEERVRNEAEERARKEREERERRNADDRARRESEERARRAEQERLRQEAEDRVRRELELRAQREAQQRAERERAEQEERAAQARARREAEERAQSEADERSKRESAARAEAERQRLERERLDGEARERSERDTREREQAARERARREAEERVAQERAAREAAARERAEREALERAAREAQERDARERIERQAREDRERADREAEARAAREAQERDARERAQREARDRADRDAQERADRESSEQAELERQRTEAADAARRQHEEHRERDESERLRSDEEAKAEREDREREEEYAALRRRAESLGIEEQDSRDLYEEQKKADIRLKGSGEYFEYSDADLVLERSASEGDPPRSLESDSSDRVTSGHPRDDRRPDNDRYAAATTTEEEAGELRRPTGALRPREMTEEPSIDLPPSKQTDLTREELSRPAQRGTAEEESDTDPASEDESELRRSKVRFSSEYSIHVFHKDDYLSRPAEQDDEEIEDEFHLGPAVPARSHAGRASGHRRSPAKGRIVTPPTPASAKIANRPPTPGSRSSRHPVERLDDDDEVVRHAWDDDADFADFVEHDEDRVGGSFDGHRQPDSPVQYARPPHEPTPSPPMTFDNAVSVLQSAVRGHLVRSSLAQFPFVSACRQRVALFRELLDSETAYVSALDDIQLVVVGQLRRLARAGHAVVTYQLIGDLFGNFEAVRNEHVALMEKLRRRAASWVSKPIVGDVLIKKAPLLRVHLEYLRCCPRILETIAYLQRFPEVADLLQTLCGRVSIDDLGQTLTALSERVSSYVILAKDLLKATPREHRDHGRLVEALTAVSDLERDVLTKLAYLRTAQRLANDADLVVDDSAAAAASGAAAVEYADETWTGPASVSTSRPPSSAVRLDRYAQPLLFDPDTGERLVDLPSLPPGSRRAPMMFGDAGPDAEDELLDSEAASRASFAVDEAEDYAASAPLPRAVGGYPQTNRFAASANGYPPAFSRGSSGGYGDEPGAASSRPPAASGRGGQDFQASGVGPVSRKAALRATLPLQRSSSSDSLRVSDLHSASAAQAPSATQRPSASPRTAQFAQSGAAAGTVVHRNPAVLSHASGPAYARSGLFSPVTARSRPTAAAAAAASEPSPPPSPPAPADAPSPQRRTRPHRPPTLTQSLRAARPGSKSPLDVSTAGRFPAPARDRAKEREAEEIAAQLETTQLQLDEQARRVEQLNRLGARGGRVPQRMLSDLLRRIDGLTDELAALRAKATQLGLADATSHQAATADARAPTPSSLAADAGRAVDARPRQPLHDATAINRMPVSAPAPSLKSAPVAESRSLEPSSALTRSELDGSASRFASRPDAPAAAASVTPVPSAPLQPSVEWTVKVEQAEHEARMLLLQLESEFRDRLKS